MSKLDYLKRYMSKEDAEDGNNIAKKKKKKSHKKANYSGFKIIDTDSLDSFSQPDEKKKKNTDDTDDYDEVKFALAEELPSVAGIVDERPAEIFYRERFTTTGWQTGRDIKEEPQSPRDDDNGHQDEDVSPPRRRHGSDDSPPRRRHDSDDSPPRRRHDSDDSPPRRRHDSDASPPRQRDNDASPPRRRHDSDASPPRRRHDSDASPPRQRNSDASPPRRRRDSDASPPRRRRDSDASPPRRRHDTDSSKRAVKDEPVDVKEEPDMSPPRKDKDSQAKTLGGKKAGLQNAKAMKLELQQLKEKEKKQFETLSSDVSGRHAETKIRGRLKEKADQAKAKNEKEERLRKELEEKFQTWNRGVKQIAESKSRVEEVLHEMDKPLARLKDDADLDTYLRDVEREEDPMLQYIKKKKEQKIKASGVKITKYPEYKGPQPPPNRFNIRPGYRWDGVDRSTGFEKRLFDKANQRKALAEEAMQWSVEDM